MSIVAAIDDTRNISVWCRSVISLAGILENVRFSVSQKNLMLLAVNVSKTTNGEVVFSRRFFREFTFNTDSIMFEGYNAQESDSELSTYSFIVASKHLVMLFKNLDSASLNYVCMRVDCLATTPEIRKYKLMVEVFTKKLIVKKFHMYYQPVSGDHNTIVSQYKNEYELGAVHHFTAETATFKLFLDLVPVATEDFSIEAKTSKILFDAYTRQVLKDRELLKQPMLVTILMATEELVNTNLGSVHACVNFRLKDVRNFINLCWSVKAELDQPGDLDPQFDTYFKENGHPIVFEYRTPDVTVTYIQMTAEDSSKPPKPGATYSLPAPSVQKTELGKGAWSASSSILTSRSDRLDTSRLGRLDVANSRVSVLQVQPEEADDFVYYSNSPQAVTYRKRASSPLESPSAKKTRDDTDYSTSDDDNTGLGPTQHNNYKPKSLFD